MFILPFLWWIKLVSESLSQVLLPTPSQKTSFCHAALLDTVVITMAFLCDSVLSWILRIPGFLPIFTFCHYKDFISQMLKETQTQYDQRISIIPIYQLLKNIAIVLKSKFTRNTEQIRCSSQSCWFLRCKAPFEFRHTEVLLTLSLLMFRMMFLSLLRFARIFSWWSYFFHILHLL